MNKKRYNFTLDEDLVNWLKMHCKENRTSLSSFINQQIHKVYRENSIRPQNVLRSTSGKPNR